MRVNSQTTFFLPLFACAVLSGCFAHSQFRGVHPSEIAKYTEQKESPFFLCGDGSSISWERVNDDHCDCPSGADEPGTSGKFSSIWHDSRFAVYILF
jgi:hypothetical protein